MALLDFLWSRFKADNDTTRKLILAQSQIVSGQFGPILQRLTALESTVKQVAQNQQDLDTAFDQFEAAFTAAEQSDQQATAEIQAVVTAILNKVPPSIDLSAEVTRLQNAMNQRQQDSAALKSAADAIQSLGGTQTP